MKKAESPTEKAGVVSPKKKVTKEDLGIKMPSAENKAKLARQKELQKRYDDECRKLNASRNTSVEAIRLCGDNIKQIKEEARAEEIVIEIASEASFGTDEPHFHITKEGKAVFVCGNVRFEADIKDVNKVVGANGEANPLDRLMDSQLIELARSIGLQIEPLARELLIRGDGSFSGPLTGLLQITWYRDIEKHKSDHLEENQRQRVEKYHRALQRYDANAQDGSQSSASGPRKSRASARIVIAADQHKKMLEMRNQGKSTGEIAVALGMARDRNSRAAIRSTFAALDQQK